MPRIGCLGPAGSFSELAAKKFCAGYDVALFPSFKEAVDEVTSGRAEFAALPIENSLNGGVLRNLDLLEREDVFAVRELVLPIDHRLATRKGVRLEEIRYVYSHEQAIGQCAEYLARCLPKAQCIFTASTAESLEKLDAVSAGIVGAHVRRDGVVLSRENIADNKNNYTRFMLVKRGGAPKDISSRKAFFCAVCEHRPGSLLELLDIFSRYGFNLTRIESRPVKERFGEYRFFIELEADVSDPRARNALGEAELYCRQFKLLGAYD